MRRRLVTVLIGSLVVVTVGAGVAWAATIEIAPAEPEIGMTELTIDVSQFAPNTAIYAVPCAPPAEGETIDISTSDCDIAAVEATVTDGDGRATIIVEWEIPADGIAVYVGDESRENEAWQVVTPKSLDDAGEPDVEVLGTNVVQEDVAQEGVVQEDAVDEDLPDTGPRELALATMTGVGLIGLGLAARGAERRLTAPA